MLPDSPDAKDCEGCKNPEQRLVQAQFGISLQVHGLSSRFCSSCLRSELLARGLAVEHPDWTPVV